MSFLPQAALAQSPQISFQGIGRLVPNVVHGDSAFWIFSRFIDSLLSQGVRIEVVYLLLSVPFVTFVIAFFRQVIGVSTFGVYTPMLLTLSFVLLGILFGLSVVLGVILISYLLRISVGKINLLYIPRTGFLLSCIALSFLLIAWVNARLGNPLIISLAIFPMLMISTISEKFSSAQSEEGLAGAVRGVVQTVIIAIISYIVIIWPWFAQRVISYPELILLPLIGTLLLGRFTGLRIVEYFRFKSLFRENIEEE